MQTRIRALALLSVFVILAGGLWWFQPWRLVTQTLVSEPLPSSSETGASSRSDDAQTKYEPEPVELLTGNLISHEHETLGVVKVIELPNGSRILRLEGFQTSDGPDLEVWLSNADVVDSYDGWFLADDDQYFSLGKLKATAGEQNYEIPAEIDLSAFSSMSIWCVRFGVSFGAAELVSANG